MTSEEFNTARRLLGQSYDQFASDCGVTPDVLRAWSQGRARIPRLHVKYIRFLVAAKEREVALQSSGLPECEWLLAHGNIPATDTPDEVMRKADSNRHHSDRCLTCQARLNFVTERFGPMPAFPVPRGLWLLRVFEWVERVPAMARPAVIGAALLATHVPVGVLFSLPRFIKAPGELATAAIGLLVAAAGGAMGGFAYSLTRPTFKRLGRSGDYLTGIVCVFAYLASLFLALPFTFSGPLIPGPTGWVIIAIFSIVFGPLITALVRSESARSASPRVPQN
jgi:hypothetical protein